MRDVCIGLAQIAPRLGDLRRNLEQHLDAVATARRSGAAVLVFPELSLTGYLLRDLVPEVALTRGDPRLARLVRASKGIDIVFGFVEEAPGHRYHNAAAYCSGGRIRHVHRKLYLPTYGMFQEGRDFAAGEQLRSFRAPHGQSGMLVCEDLWHPSTAWLLAQDGAEVVFTLSSGPTRGARPKRDVTSVSLWERLLQVTAQFQTLFVVLVNRVGCEDGLTFGGGSAVVDPLGRVITRMPPLEEGLVTVDLAAEVLRRARTSYPVLRDENLDLVQRELGRILNSRYDLRAGPTTEPARPRGKR